MLNKIYPVAFICSILGAVFWIFSSGILERFRTIEAQCAIGGLGKVSIQHQYTNTAEKSVLTVNDQNSVSLKVKASKNMFHLQGPELQGKLNLETKVIFITLGNKSYSGRCTIEQFSM
jgi:hypothetical protein